MRHCGYLLLVCLLPVGCGQEHDSASYSGAARRTAAPQDNEADAGAAAEAPPAVPMAGVDEAAADPPAAAGDVERKIIYVADVALVVEDFADVRQRIPELVRRFDGYLAQATADRTHGDYPTGRWVARIPVQSFDPFLDALVGLGVPEHRSQTAEDVTEEFVDLQARITNKQRLEERILELLEEREGKIDEIIEVERELSRVREEIERMEGRLRYLRNRTAFTTVTITAREERDYVPPQAPSFTGRVGRAWTGSLVALRQSGEWLVIAAAASVPWLVPALLFLLLLRWTWNRALHRPKA